MKGTTVTQHLDPAKDKVFVISQNDAGYDYWVLHYLFTPVKTQPDDASWSIATNPSQDALYTKKVEAEAFTALLESENYNYVYLFGIDDAFRQDYSSLFSADSPPQEGVLYHASEDAQGMLTLTPAE